MFLPRLASSFSAMWIPCFLGIAWSAGFLDVTASHAQDFGRAAKATDSNTRLSLLPFSAEEDVSETQAAGFRALMADDIESKPTLTLRSKRKDDEQTRDRCQYDMACLHEAAKSRGVEFLSASAVSRAKGGFVLSMLVVSGTDPTFHRHVTEELLGGPEDIAHGLDRAVRKSFAPNSLAGAIWVRGTPEGATIWVDGEMAGTLPLENPIIGLIEGSHMIGLRKKGYIPLTQPVDIYFKEMAQTELHLSRARPEDIREEEENAKISTIHIAGPIALLGGSVLTAASGLAAGLGAFYFNMEIERRAEQQQLYLPADAFLFQAGSSLSVTAYSLMALSMPLAMGAGGWGITSFILGQQEETQKTREAPKDAPTLEELEPGISQVSP
jgi:hypothetical protein